jgi:hypothetical protein
VLNSTVVSDDSQDPRKRVESVGTAQAPVATPNTSFVQNDPFDLTSLRIKQDYADQTPVKKLLTVVAVRRPTNQEFVRVRPGAQWKLETVVLEYGAERDLYLVPAALHAELADETRVVCLVSCINRQGDVFLWPLKFPGPDGRPNLWNQSAFAAAKLAEASWVRIKSNKSAGCYETVTPIDSLPEPEWPDTELQEMIKCAFHGRLIDTADHPVLRELKGAL